MPNAAATIPSDAINTAAERLSRLGVFADEERRFPAVSVLRLDLGDLETRLRSSGYAGGPLEIDYLNRPREGVEFVIYDRAKITDVSSAESTWYLDYQDRWHARVQARVQDWIKRLQDLRALIQSWLPEGMSIVERLGTPMREELMRRFNVPSVDMPTFDIARGSKKIMRVQPKGLWIVGANGRVDLVTEKGSWILVDKAEPIAQAPNWHLYSSGGQQPSVKFGQAQFLSLL